MVTNDRLGSGKIAEKSRQKWLADDHFIDSPCGLIQTAHIYVQWILVAGVPVLVALVAGGYIRHVKIFDFEINQTKQNVEFAVEKVGLRNQGGDKIPGDFENIKPYIDWQKFHEAVIAWARRNKAHNAWNLGPKNYLRCLYDLGIPGGRRFELEYEQDGSLKNQ